MADKGVFLPFQFNDAGGIAESDPMSKAKNNILKLSNMVEKEVKEKVATWCPNIEILGVGVELIRGTFHILIKFRESTLQLTDQMIIEY
jgi:hypothetical protein